jgi:class 3 adenylate cyclase/HAMP domain-containing protein
LIENNFSGPASRGGPAIVILVNQILRENGIQPENLPEQVRDNSQGFGDLIEILQSGGVDTNFLHSYFDQPRSFHSHPMQKGTGCRKEMWEIRRGRGDSNILFRLHSENFLLVRILCKIMDRDLSSDVKDYFILSNTRVFDFPIRNFNHSYLVRGAALVESGQFKGSMFFADRDGELFGLYAFPEERLKPYIPAVGRFIHQDFIALKYLKLRYSLIGFLLILTFGGSAVFISRHILQPLSMLAAGMDRIRQRDYDCEVQVFSRDEFKQLSIICNKLRVFLSEKERLTGFLASETRASVNIQDFSTTKESVAIIFCGILNVSDYEKMDFNAQSNIFNLFLNSVQEAIFAFDGSVDKFTGQACLGFFRAAHVYKLPLQTAVEIRRAVGELNRQFVAAGKRELEVGIGIATGNVVLGYIGSEKRRDFTSIGNTVNTAARLETFAKGRGQNIGIFFDQETFQLNRVFLEGAELSFCCHEGIFLKGKQGEQVIYELL